jgi:hypothetical protein
LKSLRLSANNELSPCRLPELRFDSAGQQQPALAIDHAFCAQSGQVNFVLLAFFAFACCPAGADYQ